jgi:hypothetical protein
MITMEGKIMNEALKKAINGISVAVVFLNLALVVLKLTKTVSED